MFEGGHYKSHNCKFYFTKKTMSNLCYINGLEVVNTPESLNLTGLEKQLIVKCLLFLKVRQLPKTRMDVINDRVINVPISDEDVVKTVISLPRSKDNGIKKTTWQKGLPQS